MIIALFNNNYSRELIFQYLKCRSGVKSAVVVSIGKTSHEYSKYCKMHRKGVMWQLKVAKEIYSTLEKKIIGGEGVLVILPNSHCIVAGSLLKLKEKHEKRVTLIQVAEGTLNYHQRKVTITESFKRIVKKVISTIFMTPYLLFLGDALDISRLFYVHSMICRKSEGIINSSKVYNEIPYKRRSIKIYSLDQNRVAIIGQHILDHTLYCTELNFKKILVNQIPSLNGKNIDYLPHPRAISRGAKEISKVYSGFNIALNTNFESAEDYIYNVRPGFVLAFGGSTVFDEISQTCPEIKLYALGLDYLIKKGFVQYEELKIYHERIGVNIIG